ncbi:MAG: hypothetical protein M3065_05465 [Actinomycetota bacterium]|nr:hypothetical protein [Actinomycetota bacterium]
MHGQELRVEVVRRSLVGLSFPVGRVGRGLAKVGSKRLVVGLVDQV